MDADLIKLAYVLGYKQAQDHLDNIRNNIIQMGAPVTRVASTRSAQVMAPYYALTYPARWYRRGMFLLDRGLNYAGARLANGGRRVLKSVDKTLGTSMHIPSFSGKGGQSSGGGAGRSFSMRGTQGTNAKPKTTGAFPNFEHGGGEEEVVKEYMKMNGASEPEAGVGSKLVSQFM